MRFGEDDFRYLAVFDIRPVGTVHRIQEDESYSVSLASLFTIHAFVRKGKGGRGGGGGGKGEEGEDD